VCLVGKFFLCEDCKEVIGSGSRKGLLEDLDLIVSSVGSTRVTSDYTLACLKIAGINSTMKGIYGDIAGIPLYDGDVMNKADLVSIRQYASRSIGLTIDRLKHTVKKGRVVIFACAHGEKELAVREACRQGLVTDLIVDAKLGAQLLG